MVEGENSGLLEGMDVERIYSRAIGSRQEATIKIGDVECRCLLDSGSDVSIGDRIILSSILGAKRISADPDRYSSASHRSQWSRRTIRRVI